MRRLGRWDEARASCQAAILLDDGLIQDQPTISQYRAIQAWSLGVLGLTRLAEGDAARATGDVQRALGLLDGLPRRSGELWFETACGHAALSALAGREGSGIPATDGPAEADKALALLKKAVAIGYRAPPFRTEPALDPLRGREDFQKLLTEIQLLNKVETGKDKEAGTK